MVEEIDAVCDEEQVNIQGKFPFHNTSFKLTPQGVSTVPAKNEIVLEGKTLGERHKHLNHLVKTASDEVLDPDKLDNLHSKPILEQVFIAKVADYKKNPQFICELLKSENWSILHITLRAKWIFKATTHQDYCNVNYFMTNIFPYVSYHSVCRIISNFATCLKNENIADDLFKLVKDLYGWRLASKLLPACSVDCIQTHLKTSQDIPCGILYKTYLKHKESVKVYLSNFYNGVFDQRNKKSNSHNFVNYDKVLRMIAKDNPEEFLGLMRKYPHACRGKEIIGKNITKHILITIPDQVVKYAKLVQYSLKNKVILRILKGKALEKYVYNALPDCYDDFPFTVMFHHLKEKYKTLMLFKLHPLKYDGLSLLDRKDYLTIDQLKYIPSQLRILWAQSKLNNITDSNLRKPFYKYLPPKIAVPELCKGVTDVEQTFDSIKEMADCYIINDEEEGLVRIIKQVTQILSQDTENAEYCIAFLFHIKDFYNIHKVSQPLWTVISRLIESLSYSNTLLSTQKLFLMSFICDQISYQVCHDLPFEGIIYKVLTSYRFDFWHSYILDLTMSIKEPKRKLIFIRTIVAKIRVLMVEGCNPYDVWKKSIFIVKLFNEMKKNVGVSFTESEWLVNVIRSNMDHWSIDQLRGLMIEINKDRKGRRIFCKEIFKHSLEISILYWSLNNDVEIITDNLPMLCNYFLSDNIPMNSKQRKSVAYKHDSAIFVRCFMKSWTDLELPKEPFNHPYHLKSFSKRIQFLNKVRVYFDDKLKPLIVKTLTNDMKNKVFTKQRAMRIVVLASLVSPAEGKSLIEENAPRNNQVSGNLKFYKTLTKSLKYIHPPITYAMLMKFFEHNCFNYVDSSVFSLGSKKSLKDSWIFIKDLVKESVIMKKMAVNLSYRICPKKELLSWYTEIWNQNINTQVKTIVFKKTFKLLIYEDKEKNCIEIWKTLKYFIGSLSEMDPKLLNYIKWSDKLAVYPIMFTEYCETFWKILKEMAARKINVSTYKDFLVECMYRNVDSISETFFETHVKDYWNYMETLDGENIHEMLPFVICYIIHKRELNEHKKKLVILCKMYAKSVIHLWNVPINNVHVCREYLKEFILKICRVSIQTPTEASALNMILMTRMIVLALPAEQDKSVCYLHLLLHIAKAYVMLFVRFVKHNPVQDELDLNSYCVDIMTGYGQVIVDFVNDIKNKYGVDHLQTYLEALKIVIPLIVEGKPDYVAQDIVMCIMQGMNMFNISDELFIMFAMLLPDDLYKGSKYTTLYQNIMSKLHMKVLDTVLGK